MQRAMSSPGCGGTAFLPNLHHGRRGASRRKAWGSWRCPGACDNQKFYATRLKLSFRGDSRAEAPLEGIKSPEPPKLGPMEGSTGASPPSMLKQPSLCFGKLGGTVITDPCTGVRPHHAAYRGLESRDHTPSRRHGIDAMTHGGGVAISRYDDLIQRPHFSHNMITVFGEIFWICTYQIIRRLGFLSPSGGHDKLSCLGAGAPKGRVTSEWRCIRNPDDVALDDLSWLNSP